MVYVQRNKMSTLTKWMIGMIGIALYVGMWYWMHNSYLGPCIDGPKSEWVKRQAAMKKGG